MRHLSWRPFLQRLLISLLIGLGIGLTLGLIIGVIDGLSCGVIYGLGTFLLQSLLVESNTVQPPSQPSAAIGRMKWQRLIRSTALRNGLLTGLLVGLINGLGLGLLDRFGAGFGYGLAYGLSNGLSFGFIGGLLSLLLLGRSVTVQLTERVIWSWKSLVWSLWSSQNRRAALQVAALVGLSIGLITGLTAGLRYVAISGPSFGLISGLRLGLSAGLSYWFLSGLSQGVAGETIEDQQRVVPNQGIHRSAKNGLVLGLVSALIVGLSLALSAGLSAGLDNVLYNVLSFGLSAGLSVVLSSGLSAVLSYGLSIGLIYGLFMGGWACLRHYVLRLLLWRAGAMPWNYSRFLDYAAEHILLRKVGGGYIFVHRLLLEYFASSETTAMPNAVRAKKEQGELVS